MISIGVLILVFILIAVRQVGSVQLPIWMVMSAGAMGVLLTGQISWKDALHSVNLDVILFLLGMFVVGTALEESGYLTYLSSKLFKKAFKMNHAILFILFGLGLLSALLMNDTLAIIGTPLVLQLAQKNNLSTKPFLLALAFAVTIGSVMSPLGNPQNLLIAEANTLGNPFLSFLKYLLIPTLINLFIAYWVLKTYFSDDFNQEIDGNIELEEIKDLRLKLLSKIALCIIGVLTIIKIVLGFSAYGHWFKLTYIALAAAMPILVFCKNKQRIIILKRLDWTTLIFFISMFILMKSVWDTNLFQNVIAVSGLNILSLSTIMIISTFVSQFISNVPLVALYLPMLIQAGASTKGVLALAAGSTIAGNLTILGAASNVIIIQNAEKKGQTITFWEFTKIGSIITIINIGVYWLFLSG